MSQVIFIALMIGLMVGPWIWATSKQKVMSFWLWLTSLLSGLVIVIEIVSKVMTDRTISQHFWAFGADNLTAAWLLSGSLVAVMLVLMWHLMAGVYKRRRRNRK